MQSYDVTTKEQVIGAWTAGASLNELVETFKVPKTTIRGWLKGRTRTPPAPKAEEVPDEGNINRVAWDFVEGTRRATNAILATFADPAWLRAQNARDLAVALGIMSDKQFRLLAAYQRSDESGDRDPDDAGEPRSSRPALPAGEVHPAEAHTPT